MKRTRYAGDISDEEIAHYLAKKAMKKAVKLAKKLKPKTAVDGSYNHSNPFGDSNLNEQFVWKKKIERDVTLGVPLDMFSGNAQKKRMKERMAEIDKVKKRREERAVEKAQHEEEMALLARERARAEFQDWEKKEEEFHFTQSKIRSEIRCHEGRMKAIDILKEHIKPSHGFDIEKEEPYMVFKGLTVKELEELQEDIKMYLEFDRETQTHIRYWEALLVVCEWELDEVCKKDTLDRARVRGERPPLEEMGLHPSIEVEVKKCLDGKSFAALERIQSEIKSKMLKSADVVEYWEAVYKRLPIYKAKACLNEVHKNMLCQNVTPQLFESYGDKEREKTLSPKVEEDSEPMVEEEEAGSFSPELLHGDESEEAIDPKDDRAILEKKRMQVLEEQQKVFEEAMVVQSPRPMDDLETRAVKSMGVMDNGDHAFGHRDEVNVDSQVCWWHDKYRPRKPKYFNRVHTGYEWNKYNQTHYDHDNPPPKTVHGYKFNIFYPDLIDSTKAPTYTIEKDDDSVETCIIRFHAGPPYEDIAFRIVNKEWEYSHKKGFKCTFERGLLHVYFNFKRYRYRR